MAVDVVRLGKEVEGEGGWWEVGEDGEGEVDSGEGGCDGGGGRWEGEKRGENVIRGKNNCEGGC